LGPPRGLRRAQEDQGEQSPLAVDTLSNRLALHVTSVNLNDCGAVSELAELIREEKGDNVMLA
jgi:hypothetical protein